MYSKVEYMVEYLIRLHAVGYPTTAEQLNEFNRQFCSSFSLQGRELAFLIDTVDYFSTNSVNKLSTPKWIGDNARWKKLYWELVADYRKKWVNGAPKAVDNNQSPASNNTEIAMQALEKKVQSLENENSSLGEKNRQMADTIRALEETVREKDQLLKAALKMGEFIINKSAP